MFPNLELIFLALEFVQEGRSKSSACYLTNSKASSRSIDVLRVTETGLWGFELTCFCISDHTGMNFVVWDVAVGDASYLHFQKGIVMMLHFGVSVWWRWFILRKLVVFDGQGRWWQKLILFQETVSSDDLRNKNVAGNPNKIQKKNEIIFGIKDDELFEGDKYKHLDLEVLNKSI